MKTQFGDLSGLRRLKNLVGREDTLKEIYNRAEDAERKKRSALIYMEGKGGIGKTAILERVHEAIKERGDALLVDHILDIYHLDHQTVRGFCDALVAAFPGHVGFFDRYREYARKADDAYVLNDYDEAARLWQDAEKALADALSNLTIDRSGRDRPVWILIDTAEMLYFEAVRQDDQMRLGMEHLSTWLPIFLPLLRGQPIIMILAGRPPQDEQPSLLGALRANVTKGWLIGKPINLNPLDASACRKYLEMVANLLENDGDQSGANRIRNYLSDYDKRLLQRETGGEPLYLAMTCDILRTGGSLPKGFYNANIDEQLNNPAVLTVHYMSLRTPLGITLQAMALLRKGADAKLLARIMGIPNDEDENDPEYKTAYQKAQEYLEEAALLTLVKERPGDITRRYFLHDEVYDLYAQQAWRDIKAWRRKYKLIMEYYAEQCATIRSSMETDPKELRRYQVQLRMAQIEIMHYALWFSPWQGFVEYFIQSIDAIAQRVKDWDILLRAEWERTTKDLIKVERYPDELGEYMHWDHKVKPIDRASTWKLSIDQGELDALDRVAESPQLYQPYIWLVRALLVLRDQPHVKEDTFSNCLEEARQVSDKLVDIEKLELAFRTLISYLDNYEGYHSRRRGNYKKALEAYHRAGVTMRKMKLGGLSTVLINQAYAMSMLGFDRRARETALEAHDIAKSIGSPYHQVRALNVRSLAETSAGFPRDGEIYALEALDILETFPEDRLMALVYISLGRVYRYQWNQEFQTQLKDLLGIGRDLLPKALAYLEGTEAIRETLKWYGGELPEVDRGAIDLLVDSPDKENWVTALNESGCLWRETAWLAQEISEQARDFAHKKAEMRLMQASGVWNIAQDDREARIGGIRGRVAEIGGSYYWPILALVNLGWHYHYQTKYPHIDVTYPVKIQDICSVIDGAIDDKYKLESKIKLGEENWGGDDILIWAALGKLEMLRGYEELRKWRNNPDALEGAIKHITLAMEYNYQLGRITYNNRRAEMGLEARIRQSKDWEQDLLPLFFKTAQIVGKDLTDKGLLSKLHVSRWLEERYGSSELWIE